MYYNNFMNNLLRKLLFICILFFVVPCAFAKNQTKYVSVKGASLKQKASASSKMVSTVDYAQVVYVLEEKGSFSFVQLESKPSIKGWIPTSALTKKKILANSNVNVSAKEIALAGKGFNKSLEEDMVNNYNYNYDAVDFVEDIKITEKEVLKFIQEGNLTLWEGEE